MSAGSSLAVVASTTYRPSSLTTGALMFVGSVMPLAAADSGHSRRYVPASSSTT